MDGKLTLIVIISILVALFFILGVIFLSGRGSSLIAGFNAKSPEEKEKYDTPALCRFMGKVMFALGLSMMPWVFGVIYEAEWMFAMGTAAFFAITMLAVVYINTGNRFKKDKPKLSSAVCLPQG